MNVPNVVTRSASAHAQQAESAPLELANVGNLLDRDFRIPMLGDESPLMSLGSGQEHEGNAPFGFLMSEMPLFQDSPPLSAGHSTTGSGQGRRAATNASGRSHRSSRTAHSMSSSVARLECLKLELEKKN